jgi:hypothetical protein
MGASPPSTARQRGCVVVRVVHAAQNEPLALSAVHVDALRVVSYAWDGDATVQSAQKLPLALKVVQLKVSALFVHLQRRTMSHSERRAVGATVERT